MANLKVVIITQARIGSTRFPSKVLEKIGDHPMLSIHLRRLKKSKFGKCIIVATTFEEGADEIVKIAEEEFVLAFKGSTNDVLDRFYQAAKPHQPDYVVRVTSDCPLVDAQLLDEVVQMVIENKLDYGANILAEEFPDGQDIEVFSWDSLEKAWENAELISDREHVTPFIRKNSDFNGGQLFKAKNFYPPFSCNSIRMTVDEPNDLDAIKTLVNQLGTSATWIEYTNYIIRHIQDFPNQDILRNEGYLKSIQNESN